MMASTKNIRLKQLRKESKITQEQLAKYLDVDQSMITKLENGTRSLNITLIEKICSLFGCSEAYLLGEDDAYIPLNFAFRSNGIQTEDLESIAIVNSHICFMDNLNYTIKIHLKKCGYWKLEHGSNLDVHRQMNG